MKSYKRKQNNDLSIFSTKYNNSLLPTLVFETQSLIGRLISSSYPPRQRGRQLLNLGSGSVIFKDWVNADMFNGILPWNRGNVKANWLQDFRYRLKCSGNYWDGIFTEHTIEHLYPNEVLFLFGELKRTLKPGAWLRISVPDLGKYVAFYNGKRNGEFSKNWKTGAEGIRSLTQNWGHHSVWDFRLLESVLKKVGFKNIKMVSFGKGTDRNLVRDNRERRWESLYVEAQKK